MPRHSLWTMQEDAELNARYGHESNLELAVYFDRTEHAIKTRACQLGITSQIINDADTGTIAAARSNDAFITAMAAAIRAGLERPPMVGVDKRPGGGPQSQWNERKGAYVPRGAGAP